MKCQHQGCSCEANVGERWCSEECQQAAREASARDERDCACGHADCRH